MIQANQQPVQPPEICQQLYYINEKAQTIMELRPINGGQSLFIGRSAVAMPVKGGTRQIPFDFAIEGVGNVVEAYSKFEALARPTAEKIAADLSKPKILTPGVVFRHK